MAQLGRSLSAFGPATCAAANAQVAEEPREATDTTDAMETFHARDLQIERRVATQSRTFPKELKFGQSFTDHMFSVEYSSKYGWDRPRIAPFHDPASIPFAAPGLHYSVSCFEGLKAYRGQDGRMRLFRPEMNLARLVRSSRRLCLAPFDPEELMECLVKLLKLDSGCLPKEEGSSLYIRPVMYGSNCDLGVKEPSKTTLRMACSPVSPVPSEGLEPITLFLNEEMARAWPDGLGDVKASANYAITLLAQREARELHGCHQVLYTFPLSKQPGDRSIQEAGAMNFFVFLEKADRSGSELVTPNLDGTILPGVVRDSVLQLARSWQDFVVSERPVTIAELRQASEERRLLEMFGTGTACMVQPVDTLLLKTGEKLRTKPGDEQPSLAQRVHRALRDIQCARVESSWSYLID